MGNQTFCSCVISEKKNIQSNLKLENLYYESNYDEFINEMNSCINQKPLNQSPQINKEDTNVSKNGSLYHKKDINKKKEKEVFSVKEEKQLTSSFQTPNLSFVKIHRKVKSNF